MAALFEELATLRRGGGVAASQQRADAVWLVGKSVVFWRRLRDGEQSAREFCRLVCDGCAFSEELANPLRRDRAVGRGADRANSVGCGLIGWPRCLRSSRLFVQTVA